MKENYYEILEISQDANETEVKKAYIKKIRQYPNEKFPEEFQLIRRAYETLSNPASRKEYDTMSTYGEEISRLEEAAFQAKEREDYDTAISNFKKILMIEPDLHNIRNQLALTLSRKGELEKAFTQFKKLVDLDPQNATYVFNLAVGYENLGDVENAAIYYKKAYQLDPNDANIIFALADLYVDQDEYHNAQKVLEDALANKSSEGFHKFLYLFKLVKVNIHSRDSKMMGKWLGEIEQLLQQYPDEKEYVADQYASLAYDLFKVKLYEWAYYLTEKAVEMNPEDEYIQELHRDTSENKVVYKEFELLEKDEKVIKPLKHNLFLYLFGDEMEEKERDESYDIMFENIEYLAENQPTDVITSLKRLDIKYPNLYKERTEFFTKVMKIAQENQEKESQYARMKNDQQIVNSLKRLMALYLSDVTDEERNKYFDDIMDEMSEELVNDVKASIRRLKSVYPLMYDLNPSFMEDIYQKLSDYDDNNSRYNSNPSQKPTSTNTSSCFVATAAYGSPLAKELDYLRFWRDEHLRRTVLGRMFIKYYYKVGPYIARKVENSNWIKSFVRRTVFHILTFVDQKHDLKANLKKKFDSESRINK